MIPVRRWSNSSSDCRHKRWVCVSRAAIESWTRRLISGDRRHDRIINMSRVRSARSGAGGAIGVSWSWRLDCVPTSSPGPCAFLDIMERPTSACRVARITLLAGKGSQSRAASKEVGHAPKPAMPTCDAFSSKHPGITATGRRLGHICASVNAARRRRRFDVPGCRSIASTGGIDGSLAAANHRRLPPRWSRVNSQRLSGRRWRRDRIRCPYGRTLETSRR